MAQLGDINIKINLGKDAAEFRDILKAMQKTKVDLCFANCRHKIGVNVGHCNLRFVQIGGKGQCMQFLEKAK